MHAVTYKSQGLQSTLQTDPLETLIITISVVLQCVVAHVVANLLAFPQCVQTTLYSRLSLALPSIVWSVKLIKRVKITMFFYPFLHRLPN